MNPACLQPSVPGWVCSSKRCTHYVWLIAVMFLMFFSQDVALQAFLCSWDPVHAAITTLITKHLRWLNSLKGTPPACMCVHLICRQEHVLTWEILRMDREDRVGWGVGGRAGSGQLRQGLGGVQPRPEGEPPKVLALAPDGVGRGSGHVPQGLLPRQPLRPPEEGGRAGRLVIVKGRLDLWDPGSSLSKGGWTYGIKARHRQKEAGPVGFRVHEARCGSESYTQSCMSLAQVCLMSG